MALSDEEVHLKEGSSSDPVYGVKGTGAAGDPRIFKKVLVDIDGNPLDVVEDDASAGKRGLVMYVKRQDTPANTSGTDGDLEVPSMTAGRLHVVDKNSDTDSANLAVISDPISDNGALPVASDSGVIYVAGVPVVPKFAIIDVASAGDNTLVAAVAAKKLRVLSAYLVASGAVTARFESGAGGTALSGQMQLAANSGFVLPFNAAGWFETASNTLLNLELSGATSVDGGLTYIEV